MAFFLIPFIPEILSFFGLVGTDFLFSWLFRDSTNVHYVMGMDFSQFIQTLWETGLWLIVVAMIAWAVVCIKIAFPGRRAIRGAF